MNSDFGMYQGYNVENKSMEMNSTSMTDTNMNMNMNMASSCGCSNPGIVCPPIYECPRERCVHRCFEHEVPQE